MTLLVTGGSGQLAHEIAARRPDAQVVGRPQFDFDRPATVEATLNAARPSVVVNAAAFTAVDAAETQPDAAARANAEGPALIARWCAQAGVPLIHLSTDYVFDGTKGAPYVETDTPAPTGVYGRTKLAGEQAVLRAWDRSVVLRTSWVYASRGKNFVLTMLAAAERHPRLRVVADQRGCPTAATDLAKAVIAVADRVRHDWNADLGGIFHVAGSGETSWHGFATAIFAEAARHGLSIPPIEAITTADWPTPARRPRDSRLNCHKLATVFDVKLPDWTESLARIMDAIYSERRVPDIHVV